VYVQNQFAQSLFDTQRLIRNVKALAKNSENNNQKLFLATVCLNQEFLKIKSDIF
jgi:hypothetical protein